HLKNATVEDVLNTALNGQNLEFRISDRTILIKNKSEDGVEAPLPVIEVSGRVVGEDGAPVVGATVTVKGTSNVAITDESGFYRLKDVGENAVLVFTSVSTETLEVKVNNRQLINVTVKNRVVSG